MNGIGSNISTITRRAGSLCRKRPMAAIPTNYPYTVIRALLWFLAPERCNGVGVWTRTMIVAVSCPALPWQATVNLFADMGVQPASLQGDLIPAIASNDVTPSVSVITAPTSGTSFPANAPVIITGTATDARRHSCRSGYFGRRWLTW